VKGIKTQRSKEKGKNKNRGNSGVPGKRKSAKEKKMMARFRCGREYKENRYWIEGEEKRCRICCEEKGSATFFSSHIC
jgi:hypothetical protein